ncbi:ABC transporter transmembrane domain-containing protein [Runella salmonicolor]|uniref:ABC transporter ATP-binding protein/permease n=1 Tax=Runella salmonicolor TaxID=2950278 RepID=A0ABT1FXJ6_9BACT|nr:ABC transporter ATP-binding protein [Runella salmonicolor]MCP1386504.1 ABC transporter ATP-binding protein/permease [Runella salmonicolor]
MALSLVPYLRQQRLLIYATVGIGILNSVVTLLLPLTMGQYYELLLGKTSNRARVLEILGLGNSVSWPWFWTLFVGLILCRGLFTYFEFRLTGNLSEQLAQYLRERVFEQQLSVSISTHRQKNVGKYLLRYASDFQSVRRYLRIGIIGFLRDVIFVGLALALLLLLNAPITGLLLVGLLPFLLIFVQINQRLKRATQQRRDQRSANLSYVQMALSGFETIQLFNREVVENERFASRSNEQTCANFLLLKWRSLLEGLLPVALYGLVAIALVGMQWQHKQSAVSGGNVITYILAVLSVRPTLRRLLRVDTVWKAGRMSLDKLDAFFAHSTEKNTNEIPMANTQQGRLKIIKGTVEFRNVTFGYDPQRPVIEQMNLRCELGQICWIEGKAKTTVFRLITKQYNPQDGEILIDNQSITSLSGKVVRKRVALVSTELPLLGRTVFEAVSYSRKSEKRPKAALLLTQIQTLAQLDYPLCLDDRIGENGQLLSKGQRTVLCWVRALLTHKPILLFDEPFEGLSSKGVEQLCQWLEKQAFHKTVILATHQSIATLKTNYSNEEHPY